MGAPSLTYFCKNGHIVLDLAHHEIVLDEPKECHYCKSTEIKSVTEWRDWDEYHWDPQTEIPLESVPPHSPIREEKHTISVPVYDVSKLFPKVQATALDVTSQCEAILSSPSGNLPNSYNPKYPHALVYLYHEDIALGLFDLLGFHPMSPAPEGYKVEGALMAADGITWFKVIKEEK